MKLDAIVVGGGFAGLAAATYLARARRSVRVIDTREPRNRFAAASHGFLGHDGSDPCDILAVARTQLLAYPAFELLEREVCEARALEDGFSVRLADGEEMEARKLILAFGLRDDLPDLAGLKERWGKTVLNCPYCHGVEFADLELGVLYRTSKSVHQAKLITEWGPTTLYLNGATLDDDDSKMLAARSVKIEPAPIAGLIGEGAGLSAIELADGRCSTIAALFVLPCSHFKSALANQLGAIVDDSPLGPTIRTDADKMTSVPNLYAVGDIARTPHSISWAVSDGVTAGIAAHRALAFG